MIFIRAKESDKALDHKHFRQNSNILNPHVYFVNLRKENNENSKTKRKKKHANMAFNTYTLTHN